MQFSAQDAKDNWQKLLLAEDAGSRRAAWLDCLITQFPGIDQAVLVWAEHANLGPFRPAAISPVDTEPSPVLATICEQALALRLPVNQSQPMACLAYPILDGPDLLGVIALSSEAPFPDKLLPWLRWGMGWLYGGRSEAASSAPEGVVLTLDLLTRLLDNAAARDGAQAVVTDAAQRLGCERVSVGFGNVQGCRIFAISHSADFSRRLDLVGALESAMDECADQGVCIRLGVTEEVGDTLLMVREHQRLQREYDAVCLLSVPFRIDDSGFGVFLFEWSGRPQNTSVFARAEALVPIVGAALAERKRLAQSPIGRFRDGLQLEWKKLIGPRHPKRKVLVLVLIAALFYLVLAEGVFRVPAPARLEGTIQRAIVAPFDGFIGKSYFRAGHVVEEGAVLATLDDRDLILETSRWDSQQTQYLKQAQDAQAQHNLAQLQISLAQTRQAGAQRELTEGMLERSRIKAPFSGMIVSGDLTQQLGAAVRKGQLLYQIAPLDHYRVILEVEDVDMRHVRVGQTGEVILAAMPSQTFPLKISLVTPVAEAREGRNFFRVEAQLSRELPQFRPGMEGVAKIEVGTRARLWIWTHRFFDWLRLQSWIWLGL